MSNPTANLTPPHIDFLDEPPPYTPRADPSQGETTVEFGPSRPFQRAPTGPVHGPAPSSQQSSVRPPAFGNSRSAGRSIWRQFSEQIDQLTSDLERRTNSANNRLNVPQGTGGSWSSYPGRSAPSTSNVLSHPQPTRNVPPPLPPRRRTSSSTSLPGTSSDFARDFYAAGTGQGLHFETEGTAASPTLNRARSSSPLAGDRGPTTVPTPGRPLLHEGKLLLYTRGHFCEKCHNTGYKHFDPLRPCNKCWTKYGRPFSGPLAYSYSSSNSSSNTQNINLQRPLPGAPNHNVGSSARQTRVPENFPRPTSYSSFGTGRPPVALPAGAVIYRPGDPGIGGELCWRCDGKGTMNIFIDIINCPVCGGCGRTFSGRTHVSF